MKSKTAVNRNKKPPILETGVLLGRIADVLWKPASLDGLLANLADFLADTTGADAVMVFIRSEGANALELRAWSGPLQSFAGRIVLSEGQGLPSLPAKSRDLVMIRRGAGKERSFVNIPGLPSSSCESFIGLPLERFGRLLGVIGLSFARELGAESPDPDILRAFARLASGTVDSALLSEEAAREAEMLSKLSGAVVSGNYIDEILQLIVSMTAEIMESKICSLMLLDEEKDELVIAATQSLSSQYREKGTMKVGRSVSGQVVTDRKPIAIKDVRSDGRYAYPEIAAREGLRSLLSVPMMVKDRILGVINLYTAQLHDFTEGETRLLQTVANQAAVAIDNTRLLSETAKMHEALETRKLVERAKGIVMKRMALGEDAAFRLLQKRSMDTCRPIKEIARALILESEKESPKRNRKKA